MEEKGSSVGEEVVLKLRKHGRGVCCQFRRVLRMKNHDTGKCPGANVQVE
jgi:hypothetical protein